MEKVPISFFDDVPLTPSEDAELRRKFGRAARKMKRFIRVKRFLDRIGLKKLAGPYFNRMN